METDEQTQLYTRLGLIGKAWTPSAPIQSEELFAGRIEQLERVLETIFEVGSHGVLFGERGVGKTSLANIILNKFGSGMTCLRVPCDSDDTFETLWDRILGRIPVSFLTRKPGFSRPNEQLTFSLASLEGARGDKAAELSDFLIKHGASGLIIIDEYDRLDDAPSKKRMADLLKNLSDSAVDLTILLVGVADDVNDLIGEHPSVERCLRQIKLPRMSDDELREIVTRGAQVAQMEVSSSATSAIVASSRGFPHYAHLLSKHAASVAAHAGRSNVGIADFREGVANAIKDVQATIREQYQIATVSKKPSLYKEVLLAAALAPSDDQGTFRPTDLIEPLRQITGRDLGVSNFFPHLSKLCSPDRGSILTKVGQKNRYRYRFTNPLMKPFVVLMGRNSGLDVDGLSVEERA